MQKVDLDFTVVVVYCTNCTDVPWNRHQVLHLASLLAMQTLILSIGYVYVGLHVQLMWTSLSDNLAVTTK